MTNLEKEHKEDDFGQQQQEQQQQQHTEKVAQNDLKNRNGYNNNKQQPNQSKQQKHQPLTFVKAIFGECLCSQTPSGGWRSATGKSSIRGGIGGFQFTTTTTTTQQCIELSGIQFIGLGAVVDELSPRERVYDTLEQLTVQPERLISIGYLVVDDAQKQEDDENDQNPNQNSSSSRKMKLETVPLDVWKKNYPTDTLSRPVKRIVDSIVMSKQGGAGGAFDYAINDFKKQLVQQKKKAQQFAQRNNNNNMNNINLFMAGITAHNLGVLYILKQGYQKQRKQSLSSSYDIEEEEIVISLFKESIGLKKQCFGLDHPQIATTLDELGIQYFAREMYTESLQAFEEAKTIRSKAYGCSLHPGIAMVLNNIACCNFQMGKPENALQTLQQALQILNTAVLVNHNKNSSTSTCSSGTDDSEVVAATTTTTTITKSSSSSSSLSSPTPATATATVVPVVIKADLDLLHIAITLCNFGYLKLRMKQYEEASSVFEEALLIQQSVLGDDNHRAIRDTLSNIDFTNAFHS